MLHAAGASQEVQSSPKRGPGLAKKTTGEKDGASQEACEEDRPEEDGAGGGAPPTATPSSEKL
jgi:hypothetical protein